MESKKVPDVSATRAPEIERSNTPKCLPDADDVILDWFSQDHPDRLQKTCWRDHNQYREYHKTL